MLQNDSLNAEALIGLAWTQTWQVAVVAAVVAIVTALACRRRPHLAYFLWLLVLVKAMTPPVWSSPTGLFSWAMAESVVASAAPLTPRPAPVPPTIRVAEVAPAEESPAVPNVTEPRAAEPVPAATRTIETVEVLLVAWTIGAVALGTWLCINWLRLSRRIRSTTEQPVESIARQFANVKDRVGLRRSARLLISRESLGPAALGWWQGTVIVPQLVVEHSNHAELNAIFAHELAHLRRFDPLIGTLQLAVQCLWWWHPAIWWANRQVRIERERSCDEAVLAQVDVRPADYARLLVELLERSRAPVPAVFWAGMRSTAATTARVRHVLETNTFRRRSPLAAWIVAALVLVVVLPGAGSRFITAAPPDESLAQNAEPLVEQQPVSADFPVAPASEAANRQQTPAEAAAFQELSALGAVWGMSGNAERRWAVTLPNSFDPGDSQLPLAALSRVLMGVSIGGQGPTGPSISAARLRAQILALKELPAEVSLNVLYTSDNASALDALLAIPNLTHLSLFCNGPAVDWANARTRPFALSDLKRLTSLALSAADGDLPEIARLTELEQLSLMGSASSAAVNDLKSLTRLKSLALHELGSSGVGASVAPLDLACLDELKILERLHIGGLLNDAAAERIGTLANLHDLSISVDGLSDAGLAAIAKAASLRTVHLSVGDSPAVSARGFSALGALKNLERLSILGWAHPGKQPLELTDESLAGWNELVNLRFLVISHCSIGDAGIRTLSSLPILYCLHLEGPLQVTDAGVAELKSAPELGALVLTASKITGSGLAPLRNCKSLGLVNLSGSPLTDAGLEALAKIKLLSELDVSGTQITDKGLASLAAQAPRLTRLNLARTAITDAGLSELERRDHLKQLNLADTKVTIAGIGQLLDANRQLMVWSLDPMTPQTRAFNPGTYQGTFQPIDGHQVLGELLTAKTAGTSKPTPTIVADTSEPATASEKVADPDTGNSTQAVAIASPEELQDLINHLKQLGLNVNSFPGTDGPRYAVEFTREFQPLEKPLPIDKLPRLFAVTINQRPNLSDAQLIARLQAVRNLPAEVILNIAIKPGQPAAIEELARIPTLERLLLNVMTEKIEPGPPPRLSLLTQVKMLQVSGEINEAVMDELKTLVNLEELIVYNQPDLSPTNLPFLPALVRLKKLTISHLDLRDAAFEHISGLPKLAELSLELTIATDEGLKQLANAGGLKRLSLRIDQTKFAITPAGLAELGRLQQLEALTMMHLPSYAYRDGPINDAAVIPLVSSLKRLKELQLYNGNFSNQALLAIGQRDSLENLRIAGRLEAQQSGLQAIGELSALKQLTLWLSDWDGQGIEHLARLNKLEELDLGQARSLTDDGLAPLAALTELKTLKLPDASIRGPRLAPLAALKRLETLALERNPIDDSGAQAIARLTSLKQLNLLDTQITDQGLATLAEGLPELTSLTISGTKVTDAGLDALMRLEHLKQVVAARTVIAKEGLKDRPWPVVTSEATYSISFGPSTVKKAGQK